MRLRLPDRGERGAIAVMTAVLMTVLLGVAALAVDITTQVNVSQKLHDTVDVAAQAGAYRLPSSGTLAASDALASFAANNGPAATPPVVPTVELFCVVASLSAGVPGLVDNSQIPATCNPLSVRGGSSPNYTWAGSRCNSTICGIPCNPAATPPDVCNTIKVTATKTVPFSFAPAIGITAPGTTGAVSSVACKGVCGTIPINPMDITVVADRTGSMSSTDLTAMIDGIKSMFTVMTPSQQYVSLGTIGRSTTTNHSTGTCDSTTKGLSWPSSSSSTGAWVPVNFSNGYLNADKTVKTTDPLVKAVTCLTNKSGTGTHLASPMKAAARYLLGPSSPYDTTGNIASLPARTGTIRKAIIFETDGAPNESSFAGTAALNDAADIGSTNDNTACTNFGTVATNAKAIPNNILVVTVGFNLMTEYDGHDVPVRCDGSGSGSSPKVIDVMAAAASNAPSGGASLADQDCGTTAGRNLENDDGDYFFCAASGTDMREIYRTAFGQIANGIRLIQLP